MIHILERGLIHFFASASLVMIVCVAISYWTRKNLKAATWLPSQFEPRIVLAALIVFALSALREPYDVYTGQTLTKAITDFVSWFLGCGVSAWGIYRFTKI